MYQYRHAQGRFDVCEVSTLPAGHTVQSTDHKCECYHYYYGLLRFFDKPASDITTYIYSHLTFIGHT